MENDFIILPNGVGLPISIDAAMLDADSPPTVETPLDPLINAALLFDGSWQNAQAARLRSVLSALLNGGAEIIFGEASSPNQSGNDGAGNLLAQNFDSLFELARTHPAFENFRAEAKEFWEQTRAMSEIRVVETYVNGKFEPRAVSHYGELLARFHRSGESLDNFSASLSPNERKVFQARYQLHQSFGANELFVGNNIALDERGQFSARVFLAGNGKNSDFSPHFVLSFLNGNLTANEFALFTNGQILFSDKSAALLGSSLAIYQNRNAIVSLDDAALNLIQPKNANGASKPLVNQPAAQVVANDGKFNNRSPEIIVIAAFINATLATIHHFGKFDWRSVGDWTNGDSRTTDSDFSAGATGAIMGASIGCIAPLAEKRGGEILGFAASVVVGLNDGGLRKLGAKTVVSIVTSGVQMFLDAASANQSLAENNPTAKLLTEAKPASVFEAELRRKLFDSRIKNLSAA